MELTQTSKNIQDSIDRCDSYWKRLGSADEGQELSTGQERYGQNTGCNMKKVKEAMKKYNKKKQNSQELKQEDNMQLEPKNIQSN